MAADQPQPARQIDAVGLIRHQDQRLLGTACLVQGDVLGIAARRQLQNGATCCVAGRPGQFATVGELDAVLRQGKAKPAGLSLRERRREEQRAREDREVSKCDLCR